jgi:hypothetical protein
MLPCRSNLEDVVFLRLLASLVLFNISVYAQTPGAPADSTHSDPKQTSSMPVKLAAKDSKPTEADVIRTAREDRPRCQRTSTGQHTAGKIQPGGQKEEDRRILPGKDHCRRPGSTAESKGCPTAWLWAGRSGTRCGQKISFQASHERWPSSFGGNYNSSEFQALLNLVQAPRARLHRR